ncbi:MAG: MBL fold metallo-hydrolase [Thermoleophilaceae bacterium]|nr:MBL fold metallo-hydrolase [Thermoleophilaceae bacterium]
MKRRTRSWKPCLAASILILLSGSTASASARHSPPDATVAAREHFFGAANVNSRGVPRRDRVILSWFSVGSLAMAIDGRVVLLDTYIHKGEERPNYVPTTTNELIALHPDGIFIGHGHFDHAQNAGRIASRTDAWVVGTAEHCDQVRAQAAADADGRSFQCRMATPRGSAPGGPVRKLRPLGRRVGVQVLKHLHSALEPPDGEGHESSLFSLPLPDPGLILLHPPGPSILPGLNPAGEEGSSLFYRFRIGRFSLAWHDSSGPLRSQAPQVLAILRKLPPTDVQVGATLGFNNVFNGMRDAVDYLEAVRPKLFYPVHQDFVAEYGASKNLEGVFRRELARRPPLPTDVRWLYDPYDYVRPELMTFDIGARRFR